VKTYKIVNSFILGLLVIFLFSCDKKDPLPISKVGFEVINKDKLERFVAVKFVNLSTNASIYKWDFGDGTFDSLGISPEHIYTEEGSYDITLTATTEDGQQTTETMSIDIKTRVLTAFSVANISFVDEDGNPWDDDGTGPDLVFAFGEQTAELDEWIITDTIVNVTPAHFPISWNFSEGNGLALNDVLHDLILLDVDPENVDDPFVVMFGIEMNPVQYEFVVKDDNDNGLIQVSIGGFAIDMFVTFALQ